MKYTPHGYKLPELDDKDFWDSINYDIERLDSHNHDGLNSAHLAPGASRAHEVPITPWVGTGPYTFDFLFPPIWDMIWEDGEACPVEITVYNVPDGNLVHLDVTREPSGLGIILTSSVAGDYLLGIR